jgi:murein L,D-transpeptidase YafK
MRAFFFVLFSFILIGTKAQTSKKVAPKKIVTTKTVAKPKTATKKIVQDTVYNPYYIIIDKSDYELQVYDDTGWLATYPVVFGSKDLTDKFYEGDKKTPDGEYKICLKKTNKQWGLELLLDFPNEKNIAAFNQRKSEGKIPKGKKIGNGIAIHGTRPGSEWTVDNFVNWTDGCISVKYTDMKELYELIPQWTKVTIQQ